MENRKSYEIMLNSQCGNHERMLQLLTKISEYDDILFSEAEKRTPDVSAIEYCNIQKNRLIKQMDDLSKDMVKIQSMIEDAALHFLDGNTHPLYKKLKQLEEILTLQLSSILDYEDLSMPEFTKNLVAYKERLDLDLQISRVPKEKRKVFFYKLKN